MRDIKILLLIIYKYCKESVKLLTFLMSNFSFFIWVLLDRQEIVQKFKTQNIQEVYISVLN